MKPVFVIDLPTLIALGGFAALVLLVVGCILHEKFDKWKARRKRPSQTEQGGPR